VNRSTGADDLGGENAAVRIGRDLVAGASVTSDVLERARSLFPHLSTGKVYFNHAATGPLSTRVIEAMQQHLFGRSAGSLDTYESDMKMIGELRARAAALVNAPSPDRIALPPNTSEAIAIVASGLDWRPGDRVLLNSAEFPANVYPYLALRRSGVELDVLRCERGAVTPEMIESSLTPRTRLVALSAVQFLSGYRADMAAIGDTCTRRGVVFAVDGIQAVGAVRIDVQAMRIDALAAGAQKWQLSPHGSGLLYVTEELQSRITPSHLGWLSADDPWKFYDYDQPLAASARRYEPGTPAIPCLWGMHASLGLLLEVGRATIERSVLANSGALLDGLRAMDGVDIHTPADPDRRAGIVTIGFSRGTDPHRAFLSLSAAGIMVSLREGLLRFSPHFYNTPTEIETALGVLGDILRK
jgi:selenocysteine lyase/cysteine desulfurase